MRSTSTGQTELSGISIGFNWDVSRLLLNIAAVQSSVVESVFWSQNDSCLILNDDLSRLCTTSSTT